MNREEFFKKYVQPNTVVHCKTEELANELLAKADEYGYVWCSGGSYLEDNVWYKYKDETCYNLYAGQFCPKGWYQDHNFTIIEFNGFEESAEQMFEKLGFEFKYEDSTYIVYEHFNSIDGIYEEIRFNKQSKSYKPSSYTRNNLIFPTSIDVRLHTAIHQQMEELGWDKEEVKK